ncbi:hypothetical protein WG68_10275 [Arsukibacterium ikkense]|uniref:DUF2946 domain-containing protein n=1 Tax=Arsukibacterium ikkense TaxID=336831 RepID=A0A0M2V455_9GAMM|nr:hypothetical protein [Arsukibacterium ikkense]KKO45431.1 hypothetical protein WG68_10275 [Arsukibacterium ikkense]
MLSTLVQQQKHWTIPLMVSLALSWCLLLCAGLVNQAHAEVAEHSQVPTSVLTEKTPPCHSQQAQTNMDAAELTAQHDNCSGCDTQATQLDPLSLPALVLLVSWLHITEIWPSNEPVNNWFAQAPPPRPSVPLYLRKNLLLI